jgi:protein-disulfide isomerase
MTTSIAGVAVVGVGGYSWLRVQKTAAAAASTPAVTPPAAASAAAAPVAPVATGDQRKTIRAIGSITAPVTVTEFFSLTCTHCAAFTRETFPDLKAKLIDTGMVHWVFSDYPLDQIALAATMVARNLPLDLYEPFVVALFQGQMSWAFNSNIAPMDGLAREAALAGMPRDQFDKVVADEDLKNWILQERTDVTNNFNIDATPTFRADGPKAKGQQKAGEMDFAGFTAFLATVS